MNFFKKFFVFIIIFNLFGSNLSAMPHYIDFQQILNQSIAGKKAQDELKSRLKKTIEKQNTNQTQVEPLRHTFAFSSPCTTQTRASLGRASSLPTRTSKEE